MKEYIINGNKLGEFNVIKSNHPYAEEIIDGIYTAIELMSNSKSLKILNVGDIILEVFDIIENKITDDLLLQHTKSLFKHVNTLIINDININTATRNYSYNETIKILKEKEIKLNDFIKTL